MHPAHHDNPLHHLLGEVVGEKYKVVGRVARGSMGVVYSAEQMPLGRLVALKVMAPRPEHMIPAGSSSDGTGDFVRRFLREASSAGQLDHPNTATIYDYGEWELRGQKIWYIAMELVDGSTLSARVRKQGAFDTAEASEIAIQMLSAIEAAHERGILHRDLKPTNVLLSKAGRVKVVDFGLAKKLHGGDQDTLTHHEALMGTPGFMSPEQILNRELDFRSDVYSAGCVVYFMVAGKNPYKGESHLQTMSMHLSADVPRLPDTAGALADVIWRSMAKEPDDRYASIAAFRQAIEDSRKSELSSPTLAPPPVSARSDVDSWLPLLLVGSLISVALALVVGGVAYTQLPDKDPVALTPAPAPTPPPTAPKTRSVHITSVPAGARVAHDATVLGSTPLDIQIPAGKTWELLFELEGHEPRRITAAPGAEEVDAALDPIPPPTPPRPTLRPTPKPAEPTPTPPPPPKPSFELRGDR